MTDRMRSTTPDDAGDAARRFLVHQQCMKAVIAHIDGESEEGPADESHGDVLDSLPTDRVEVGAKSPLRGSAGTHLDDAVEPEANQCDAARQNSGRESYHCLQRVVPDGQVVEPEPPLDENGSGRGHLPGPLISSSPGAWP